MRRISSGLCLLFPAVVFLVGACATASHSNQLRFGVQAAQNDLWDEAIFRWRKVLSSNPDSAAAYNNLAVAYEQKGRMNEAEAAYQKALELDPDNEYIEANLNNFKKNLEQMQKVLSPEEKKEKEKKERNDALHDP
jgi:Flp pilus assembly protein TadD